MLRSQWNRSNRVLLYFRLFGDIWENPRGLHFTSAEYEYMCAGVNKSEEYEWVWIWIEYMKESLDESMDVYDWAFWAAHDSFLPIDEDDEDSDDDDDDDGDEDDDDDVDEVDDEDVDEDDDDDDVMCAKSAVMKHEEKMLRKMSLTQGEMHHQRLCVVNWLLHFTLG